MIINSGGRSLPGKRVDCHPVPLTMSCCEATTMICDVKTPSEGLSDMPSLLRFKSPQGLRSHPLVSELLSPVKGESLLWDKGVLCLSNIPYNVQNSCFYISFSGLLREKTGRGQSLEAKKFGWEGFVLPPSFLVVAS